jgi:hypothetical protein
MFETVISTVDGEISRKIFFSFDSLLAFQCDTSMRALSNFDSLAVLHGFVLANSSLNMTIIIKAFQNDHRVASLHQ